MMRPMLVAAWVMLLAGCSPPAPAPSDPRVYLTPDAGVAADVPVVVPGLLLRASIRLVNPAAEDRAVIQTTDWVDAAGLPVRTLLSAPQRLTVPRHGDTTISLIAPTPAAIQFRVRVEPDNSANSY